jgi:PAS domain-containing protein
VELLRRRGLDTPFILVSGTLGEEAAVAAIKLGADDFLLKDRPARLGVAIEHVLEEKRLRREHQRAELALRQSEERYRTLFETMVEGFCTIELRFDAADRPVDYRLLEFNPAYERQIGLPAARGIWMRDLAPEREPPGLEIYGRIALTGEPAQFENEIPATDRWHEIHAYRVGEPASRKVGILSTEITARKQSERKLAESHEQLRALLARLQRAQEEERGRVAREIHDELGQLLTGLKMDVCWLERKLSAPDLPAG